MSQNLRRPREKKVLWLYWWRYLMTSHHPAKFSGHERCGSGMFFVVEEHDFTCLLNSLFFLKHMLSWSHIRNFTSKIWRNLTSTCVPNKSSSIRVTYVIGQRAIKYKQRKLLCLPETVTRRRKKKRTGKAIAKLFALNANTKSFS